MPYIDYTYQRYPLDFIIGRSYDIQFLPVVPPNTTVNIVTGSFPYGMTYDPNTNRLTGTPFEAGRSDIVINVLDTYGEVVISYSYSIGVFRFTISPGVTDTTSLAPYQGVPQMYFDVASPQENNFGPYSFDVLKEATWEILENKLPKGVDIVLPKKGEQSATLVGMPVEAGDFFATLRVTDPDGHQYENTFYFNVPEMDSTLETIDGVPQVSTPNIYGATYNDAFIHYYSPSNDINGPYWLEFDTNYRLVSLKSQTGMPLSFNPAIDNSDLSFSCTPIYEHDWYYNIYLKDAPVTRRYQELPDNEVVRYIAVGDDYLQLSIIGEEDDTTYKAPSFTPNMFMATSDQSNDAFKVYAYNTYSNIYLATTHTTLYPIRGLAYPSQNPRLDDGSGVGLSVIHGPVPDLGPEPHYVLDSLTSNLTVPLYYATTIFPTSIALEEITEVVSVANNGIYNTVYVLTKGCDFFKVAPTEGPTSSIPAASMGGNYYCCGTVTWDAVNSYYIVWILNKTERKLIKAQGLTGDPITLPIDAEAGAFLDVNTKESMCAGVLDGVEYLAITDRTNNTVRLFRTSDNSWSTVISIQNPSGVYIGNNQLSILDDLQNKISVFSFGNYTTPINVISINNSYLNQAQAPSNGTQEERTVQLYRPLVPGTVKIRQYPSDYYEMPFSYIDDGLGNLKATGFGLPDTTIDYETGTFSYWTNTFNNYPIKLDYTPRVSQFKGIKYNDSRKQQYWFINNRFMVGLDFINTLKETLMVGKISVEGESVKKLYYIINDTPPVHSVTVTGATATTLSNKAKRGEIPYGISVGAMSGDTFTISGGIPEGTTSPGKNYFVLEVREDNPIISFWTNSQGDIYFGGV